MIEFIVIISVAFYWLMVETRWLSIRLQRFVPLPQSKAVDAILELTPLIVIAAFIIAAVMKGFVNIKKGEKEQHEAEMANLWKLLGRKQPEIPQGS